MMLFSIAPILRLSLLLFSAWSSSSNRGVSACASCMSQRSLTVSPFGRIGPVRRPDSPLKRSQRDSEFGWPPLGILFMEPPPLLSSEEFDHPPSEDDAENETKEAENVVSSSMILAIGFYKGFISPLIPPACRFVPTCSQYGVKAIEDFGPARGFALIIWRLLRCSPLGGTGYDPPRWPPVEYTYGRR